MSFYYINDNEMVREDMIAKVAIVRQVLSSERATGTMHDGAKREVIKLVFYSYSGEELGYRVANTMEQAQEDMDKLMKHHNAIQTLSDMLNEVTALIREYTEEIIPANSQLGKSLSEMLDTMGTAIAALSYQGGEQ